MPKIDLTDLDNVSIDGHFVGDVGRAFAGLASTPGGHVEIIKALRDWHQGVLDGHQGDSKARTDQHAAEIADLKQQHADAMQQAEADRAKVFDQIRADADAHRQAFAEWQATQEAERAKRQAEHEAALKDLADKHRATTEHLEVELQQSQATLAQIADALKELGDIPQVLALARERRAEKLQAELEALRGPEAAPRGMMAAAPVGAPGFGLYRATDGRIAKVIRQGPGIVYYWEIDDVKHADDPIGKTMRRMTVNGWREAGFAPYTPEDET